MKKSLIPVSNAQFTTLRSVSQAQQVAGPGAIFSSLFAFLKDIALFFGNLKLITKILILMFLTYLAFGLTIKESGGLSFKLPGITAPAPKMYGTGEDSEFAPADPNSLKGMSVKQYVRKFQAVAVKEMHRTGIPASITLAQGIIESRSGDSRLARQLNNHFGIKCFSKKCRKGHCENFTDDHHKDFFRKFTHVEQSFKEHSHVVLLPRYANKVHNKHSYKDWAAALQNGGYATGSQYGSKLVRIIERYDLNQFDK